MGAVGSAAVAAAVWLTAVGLAGPAGVQAATQTEIVAIEEADVHESLNRFLEEKEARCSVGRGLGTQVSSFGGELE